MPDCGVHYLWFAFVCFLIRSPPPPLLCTVLPCRNQKKEEKKRTERKEKKKGKEKEEEKRRQKRRPGARPGRAQALAQNPAALLGMVPARAQGIAVIS